MIAKNPKFKRGERSEERPRDMNEFYKDMMKPLSNLCEKRQCKKKADELKDKEVKTEYTKRK